MNPVSQWLAVNRYNQLLFFRCISDIQLLKLSLLPPEMNTCVISNETLGPELLKH